jgi:squalene synthase HpnC
MSMASMTADASVSAAERGWRALPASYAIPERRPTLVEAHEYCRNLAHSHYENFSVASWFLPKRLRQHFYNVYAYCRIADDLGDEVGDPEASLALFDQWEAELDRCYDGSPLHPVFVALAETVLEFEIPKHEFSDLLKAFRQDQTVMRYESFDDFLKYCRNSANPVGHLVLHLGGYRDADRQRLSDFTCTALQLTNSWQDVAEDFDKGRVYLPQEDLRRFGVREAVIAGRQSTPEFCELMRFQVKRTREWFRQGLPLVRLVHREVARDVELFSRGGMEILDAIGASGYDVLSHRPTLSRNRKLALVARAAWSRLV